MHIFTPYWTPAECTGFLLDWDGVIADTKLDFSPIREKYFGGRHAMLLEEANTLPPDIRESYFKDLLDLEMDGANNATPVEGAINMLSWLDAAKKPYCILSRNNSMVVKRAAEVIGVKLPENTFCRDNLPWIKPDPQALFAAAKAIHTPWRECVYIGDYLYDLQGARRAGIRAILVQRDMPEWLEWADVIYPHMTDLVEALNLPQPLVPWEYREITSKKGKEFLEKAASLTLSLPDSPSPTIDCWLARAASLGVQTFCIDKDIVFTPKDWKNNPALPVSAMGHPLFEIIAEFLSTRYPLSRVVTEADNAITAPKNSLDLLRFIDRKKI